VVVVAVIRGLLAVAFLAAGATKLVSRAKTGEAARGFGVPPWAMRPVAVALPLVEIAVAVALVPV
jgi:uncharacterized membrane protein YphA (DoxX/SURF4 family)